MMKLKIRSLMVSARKFPSWDSGSWQHIIFKEISCLKIFIEH